MYWSLKLYPETKCPAGIGMSEFSLSNSLQYHIWTFIDIHIYGRADQGKRLPVPHLHPLPYLLVGLK